MVELIAHRAGNDGAVDESIRPLADTVEIDVHLHRGELVVRHAKRVWFTSRLWERWHLLPADTEVPRFDETLAALGPDIGLWVDGKGPTPRLPPAVLAALGDRRPVTISTKSWWALRSVAGRDGVRVIRSAGNKLELFLLQRLPSRVPLDGVVIHSRLLDPDLVTQLRDRFGSVSSWSIPDVETGNRLAGWGVDGLIVDEPSVMAGLQTLRSGAEPPPAP